MQPWRLLIALVIPSEVAATTRLICEDAAFSITASEPATAAMGCEAVATAVETLGSCGFSIDRPASIEKSDTLSSEDCHGLYHCGEDRIEIISPENLAAGIGAGPFAGLDLAAYWKSRFAHEIAHAACDAVDCPLATCMVTAECFACAMQVQSLSETERQKFEDPGGAIGKVSRDRIDATLLLMATGRFARLAWAHLDQRPDRCAYLGYIMRGDLFFDTERP